jgi:hypothetical protein
MPACRQPKLYLSQLMVHFLQQFTLSFGFDSINISILRDMVESAKLPDGKHKLGLSFEGVAPSRVVQKCMHSALCKVSSH